MRDFDSHHVLLEEACNQFFTDGNNLLGDKPSFITNESTISAPLSLDETLDA